MLQSGRRLDVSQRNLSSPSCFARSALGSAKKPRSVRHASGCIAYRCRVVAFGPRPEARAASAATSEFLTFLSPQKVASEPVCGFLFMTFRKVSSRDQFRGDTHCTLRHLKTTDNGASHLLERTFHNCV